MDLQNEFLINIFPNANNYDQEKSFLFAIALYSKKAVKVRFILG